MRRIANYEEMIDILSSLKAGTFVTIGYITATTINKTPKTIDMNQLNNDIENNKAELDKIDSNLYNQFQSFQRGESKLPIGELLKVVRCQFNWQTEQNYRDGYAKYADARNEILKSYGVDPNKGKKTDTQVDYGKGISTGSTENTKDRLYTHQNGNKLLFKKTDYYLINKDGEMIGNSAISPSALSALFKKPSIDGVAAMRAMNKSDAEIEEYIQKIKDLKFSVMKINFDHILYVSCTYNNEKVFFFNDKIAMTLGSGKNLKNIDLTTIIRIVKEQLKAVNIELNESFKKLKKKTITLCESDIKKIVKETISRLLL